MNDILMSMRLDHFILKPRYGAFAFVFVIGIFFAAVLKAPGMVLAAAVVFSAPLFSLYFSIYEKNGLNKLYGMLPLGKNETVIGRYCLALLIVVIDGIIAGILTVIMSRVLNAGITQLYLAAYASAGFFFFCLMIGLLFPLYFRFGFSKFYMVSNLPFYILFVLIFVLTRKTGFPTNLANVIQYCAGHQALIWVTGFGAGLVLLLISCFAACLVYQKTEL